MTFPLSDAATEQASAHQEVAAAVAASGWTATWRRGVAAAWHLYELRREERTVSLVVDHGRGALTVAEQRQAGELPVVLLHDADAFGDTSVPWSLVVRETIAGLDHSRVHPSALPPMMPLQVAGAGVGL
jgi:hypothetical protein